MDERITHLEDLIGRTLVFGIPGPRLTVRDVKLFRETRAAGLILYRINYESPDQIRKLIGDLEEALGRRLLVTMDHEGGRVVMLGGGVTVFPDNLAFGHGGSPRDTAEQGRIEARELRRLGIDVNFAPVVDVLTDDYSPNIGIRSYGDDPRRVAALAAGRIKTMQAAGVSACAKHFPGLGPATLDPHLDLPVIRVGWGELRRRHLVPFETAVRAGVDMVMSSHPLYPNLDGTRVPATFSRRIVTGVLRGDLGFRGVAVSDDLEMGALRRFGGPGPSAVRAVQAGHDLILCCHRADFQRRIYRDLRDGYKTGALRLEDLEKSVERISALRAWKSPRFAPGTPAPEPGAEALARRVARRAVTVTGLLRPLDERKSKVCIVFPRLSEPADKIFVEEDLLDEKAFLKTATAHAPVNKDICIVPLNPKLLDVRRAVAAARAADRTVFFCYETRLMPGCRRMLDALQRASKNLVVVLLRSPYDRSFVRPGVPVVTAFGYRLCQIKACLEKIFPARPRPR
jgi:beta-N-acetylhexosaminidase